MKPAMRTLAAALALGIGVAALVPAACGRRPAGAKWADHMGDVKFTVGWKKGLAAADVAKKPLVLFFTADW